MKKKIAIILALSGVLLSGCASDEIGVIGGADGPTAVIVATPETTSETPSETTSEENKAEDEIPEDVLCSLFEENLNCMYNIFVLSSLNFEEEQVAEHIHRVTDEKFGSYAEFESYVRSVYCKETADMFLYDYPYEDNPMYRDVDGELCVDSYLIGGKGYYVDWTDYTLEIVSCEENRCEFTVTGSFTEPSDNPVEEPYTVTGVAVKEDGKWVLEAMIH